MWDLHGEKMSYLNSLLTVRWLKLQSSSSDPSWQSCLHKLQYTLLYTVYRQHTPNEGMRKGITIKITRVWLPQGPKWTLQRQNTEISKQIFPENEYWGLSPNFHIHASVSDLYISTIGLPILLQEICRPILGLNKSLTDTWMLKLGLRPRYSQKNCGGGGDSSQTTIQTLWYSIQ